MGHRTWMGERQECGYFQFKWHTTHYILKQSIEGANRKACEHLSGVTECFALRPLIQSKARPRSVLPKSSPKSLALFQHQIAEFPLHRVRELQCTLFQVSVVKSVWRDRITCEAALTLIATSLIGTFVFLRYTRSVMNAEAG